MRISEPKKMGKVLLSELANIVGGRLITSDLSVVDFVIDGRKAKQGSCYVALIGHALDGHDFIEQAIANGASSVIVSKQSDYPVPALIVEDTAMALGQIAAYHRRKFNIPVVALTGSCGKTSVKEMMKNILPDSAFVTPGNLNNHIGVPLCLLSLNEKHSHAVFELAANHGGEIAQTAEWVHPDCTLINNIAPAHLEGFGSIEGVAKAKGEIFEALDPNTGIAVVNFDDERVKQQALKHSGKFLSYSMHDTSANIVASELKPDSHGCYQWQLSYQQQSILIHLAVPGIHSVTNALAAAAMSIALNFSLEQIKHGLEQFNGVSGRLTVKKGLHGVRLIDDTYNANLHSVKAAIDVLAQFDGYKALVLGELAEVGQDLAAHYQEITEYSKQKKIDALYTCGHHRELLGKAYASDGRHFAEQSSLIEALKEELLPHSTLLVKGSRSSNMERVVEKLL